MNNTLCKVKTVKKMTWCNSNEAQQIQRVNEQITQLVSEEMDVLIIFSIQFNYIIFNYIILYYII